jgi:hypothetical protein
MVGQEQRDRPSEHHDALSGNAATNAFFGNGGNDYL